MRSKQDPPRPDPSGYRSPPPRREGFKDTAESVIIALILAFVFRAFVIEAFVIPTGSMAPTLYGKHGTMTCSNCGWEYAYGLTDQQTRRERSISPWSEAPCPNCGYPNRTAEFFDLSPHPSIESGDRILVLKWPFDIGGALLGPHRWDVTVFKNPRDGVENFIKRLVGLPGEVLEIIDGDVYTVPTDKLSPTARATLDRSCQQKYLYYRARELERQLQEPSSRSRREAARPDRQTVTTELRRCKQELVTLNGEIASQHRALLAELDRTLRIARKTSPAQEALWSVVYDADYPPRQLVADRSRLWRLEQSPNWELHDRAYRFRGVGSDEQVISLGGPPIDDSNTYNVAVPPRSMPPFDPVSDLRLRAVLSYHDGDGCVRLGLSKRGRTFWATFQADGRIALEATHGQRSAEPQTIAVAQVDPLQPNQPIEIAFENVDYRLAVSVGTREVLATSWLVPPVGEARAAEHDWHATVNEIRTQPASFLSAPATSTSI
jgi:signal peptidase I